MYIYILPIEYYMPFVFIAVRERNQLRSHDVPYTKYAQIIIMFKVTVEIGFLPIRMYNNS